jgi:hypothetical protein
MTFSTAPSVSFVLQFSVLLFFTPQSSARYYDPRTSSVLSPEDRILSQWARFTGNIRRNGVGLCANLKFCLGISLK